MRNIFLALALLASTSAFAQNQKLADVKAAAGGVPAGAVIAFATATCPQGWLATDGTSVSQATYPALWSSIGTYWGTSAGNIVLPNFNTSGRYLRGGTISATPANNIQAQMTAANGLGGTAAGQTLGSTAAYLATEEGVGFTLVGPIGTTKRNITTSGITQTPGYNFYTNISHSHPASDLTITGDTETRPITAVVNYCIKF